MFIDSFNSAFYNAFDLLLLSLERYLPLILTFSLLFFILYLIIRFIFIKIIRGRSDD